ncbi:hypothetical protein LUZ60_008560 [Juncus effusus]|nr:hypothetical protein LUZ60_008560 [Juncus effusus]
MSSILAIANSHKNLKTLPRHQLLDLNVISAQILDKNLVKYKLYAVISAYPDDRQLTQTKRPINHEAAWNEQFVVRVDDSFLNSETASIIVSVYAVGTWARLLCDQLLGSTRIVVSTFLNHSRKNVALQIREPKTLEPCGILNVTVSLLSPGRCTPPALENHGSNRHSGRHITTTPQSCSMRYIYYDIYSNDHSINIRFRIRFFIIVYEFNRFDSKHKLDEDIEYAFIEQRRIVDKSGPIEMEKEQEQTERENLVSKIEQWKVDLSSENSKRRHNRSMSHVNLPRFRFCLCGGGMRSEKEK